jgi:hypothetical protein
MFTKQWKTIEERRNRDQAQLQCIIDDQQSILSTPQHERTEQPEPGRILAHLLNIRKKLHDKKACIATIVALTVADEALLAGEMLHMDMLDFMIQGQINWLFGIGGSPY